MPSLLGTLRFAWITTASASLVLLLSSCGTVGGTAVSPITGGVDLSRCHLDDGGSGIATPFVFLGGAIAGPLVALWNGLDHDLGDLGGLWRDRRAEARPHAWSRYWATFPELFHPFERLRRHADGHSRAVDWAEPAKAAEPREH